MHLASVPAALTDQQGANRDNRHVMTGVKMLGTCTKKNFPAEKVVTT